MRRTLAALSWLAVSQPQLLDFDPQQTSETLWLCREHHFAPPDFALGGCLSLAVHSSAGVALFVELLRNATTSCNVHSVDIETAALSSSTSASFIRSVTKYCPLRSLRGFANRIDDAGAAELSELLTHVEVIDLGGNAIGSSGASSLSVLLKRDEPGAAGVRQLLLHDNTIGSEGCAALGTALRGNAQLALLNLNGNPVGESCGLAIAAALRDPQAFGTSAFGTSALEALFLYSTGLGDEGARALLEAMRGAPRLLTLELGGNPAVSAATLQEVEALMAERWAADAPSTSSFSAERTGLFHAPYR